MGNDSATAGVLLMVVMLVGIVGMVAKLKGSATPRETPPAPTHTFRVFTLGVSGAGKTCFMASLYSRLKSVRISTGFYLRVSPEHHTKLTDLYAKISNPEAEWPAGTSNDREWVFSLRVPSRRNNESFHAFDFTYLDYAGGHLKDADKAAALRAHEKVADAHAVLVLIDGLKILRRLARSEDRDPRERLGADLDVLMPYLNDTGTKPVHIVLTKWDLLANQYGLTHVRDCLMAHPDFKDFVAMRSDRGIPTRLIPISAVGLNFVTINHLGQMVKATDVNPVPLHVEVSRAATLSDAFETVVSQMTQAERSAIHALAHGTAVDRSKAWAWLVSTASSMLSRLPFPVSVVGQVGPYIRDYLLQRHQTPEDLDKQYRAAMQSVTDRESAIRTVLASHKHLLRSFEVQYPESLLASGNLEKLAG